MTVAVAAALMKWRDDGGDLRQIATESMRTFARSIPCGGYGGRFAGWLFGDDPRPYNSWGNGSAMRVSACGWIGTSLDEVKSIALQVTDISHNHLDRRRFRHHCRHRRFHRRGVLGRDGEDGDDG